MARTPSSPLIDVDLWARADWFGVAFLGPRREPLRPSLGLLFRDEAAAARIFTAWRRRFGPHDARDELRIAFLEDATSGQAPAYSILVGSSVDPGAPTRAYRLADSGALAGFKAAVAEHRRYDVVAIVLGPGRALRALDHLRLEKRAIVAEGVQRSA